jgi:hypothetical protein
MRYSLPLLILLLTARVIPLAAQDCCEKDRSGYLRTVTTAYDSALASRVPLVSLPESYRSMTLPSVVDNSALPFFPGIYAQYVFFSCQQYAGVTYDYTYEVNRLRNVAANVAENRYPAHYTWNFMNFGGQYIGVNFLHTFHALMQQGQMSRWDYGPDTAQQYLGWISGYEKYEKSFPNRIKGIRAIRMTSEEGILTLKHFLNDHLDGSATGGVACFTAAGPGTTHTFPAGTPEEGKNVVLAWPTWATHGMTIVGYNDSVRYDINNDGQYTNNIDINGDGTVDAKDWEIGAFKFANSYGTWWADGGYCYVLYEAMVSGFEYGGVWNNCVYIVDPDTAYVPLLGMEFRLKYNQRNYLRITAGVNADTSADFPAHSMEFPFFNFQGGPHVMQGNDTIPAQDEIELGLDVTPLVGYVQPGKPAKYFFILEENDPYHLGSGMIQHVAFHNYSGGGDVFVSPESDVPVIDQGTTYVSATGVVDFSRLEITTPSLPPCTQGQPWSAQLAATGGKGPYKWRLMEQYRRSPIDSGYSGSASIHLLEESDEIPYARVVLPFHFPFFGKHYDTVYMNSRGMLQMSPDHLPYPYLIGWEDMLRNVPVIFPGFAWYHRIVSTDSDGMWVDIEPDKVTFRWKVSLLGFTSSSDNSFELVIFPDGSFKFHYGSCVNSDAPDRIMAGYSRGDDSNYGIVIVPDITSLTGTSVRYNPPVSPSGIALSESGMLTLEDPDAGGIYDIRVSVTDEQLFVAEKEFQISTGILIKPMLTDSSGMAHFGEILPLDLEVTNTGQAVISELQMVLRCDDTLVLITDSTVTATNLVPGQPANIPDAFGFELRQSLPDGAVVYFTIEASAASGNWYYTFPVIVSAPDIRLTSSSLHDCSNNLLDPGEIADLEAVIGNLGTRPADSVQITCIPSDTSLTVFTPSSSEYETLPANGAVHLKFRLQASRYVPAGSTGQILLHFTASGGIDKQFVINLQLGSRPVALINLATATSSVAPMKAALDSLGAKYSYYTWLGPELMNYPVIFLILGTYQGSHFLTDNEGSFFASYLRNGGKMYMESYADWAHNSTEVSPMFHFTTQKVPVFSFLQMKGLESTFLEGLAFPYTGAAYYTIYDFLPVAPGFAIAGNTDTVPHPLQIAYDGDDYKTIGSMTEFGKLADSAYPSTKTVLMERYLHFFGVTYKGPYPYFHADPTTVCRYHPVQFTDDSYDNIISWNWEFPGGEPSFSDLQNPSVVFAAEGDYDITLTVSDGTTSNTLTRKKFIHVDVCAVLDETSVLSDLVIYPNPAKDVVNIILPLGIKDMVCLTVFDITGKGLQRVTIDPKKTGLRTLINTSGMSSGIYVILFTEGKESITRKLIISR